MLPFVADAVAHAFFYQQHIATVHIVNGKRHVHHEFVRAVKNDHAGDNTAGNKKINPADDHLFLSAIFKKDLPIFIEPVVKSVYQYILFPPLFSDFPPPKNFVA